MTNRPPVLLISCDRRRVVTWRCCRGRGRQEVEVRSEGEWNRGKIGERSSNMDDMWMGVKVLCERAYDTFVPCGARAQGELRMRKSRVRCSVCTSPVGYTRFLITCERNLYNTEK